MTKLTLFDKKFATMALDLVLMHYFLQFNLRSALASSVLEG
jgi:hypothetical protein